MINKLQYLGEVKHRHMNAKDNSFASNKILPYNKVYYRMVRWDGDIMHQWFISQNEEVVEEGYVNTYPKYISVGKALTEMLGEWKNN